MGKSLTKNRPLKVWDIYSQHLTQLFHFVNKIVLSWIIPEINVLQPKSLPSLHFLVIFLEDLLYELNDSPTLK